MAGVEFLTPEPAPGEELPPGEPAYAGHRRGIPGRMTIIAGLLVAAVLVAAIVRASTSGDRHPVAAPTSSTSTSAPSPPGPQPVVPPPNAALACKQRVMCEFLLVLPRPAVAALRSGFPGVHLDSSRSVVIVDDTHQPYLLTRDAAGTIRTAHGTVQLSLHIAQPSSADPSGTIYDGDSRYGRFSFTRRTGGLTVTIAVTGPGQALPSVLTVSRVADDPDLLAVA